MDMDFATSCPLVRPALPRIRFLFVGSRFRSTLPSDGPSRFRPCASLVLHLHQVAQGTFTPRLLDMPSTQDAARRLAPGPLRGLLDSACARRSAVRQVGTKGASKRSPWPTRLRTNHRGSNSSPGGEGRRPPRAVGHRRPARHGHRSDRAPVGRMAAAAPGVVQHGYPRPVEHRISQSDPGGIAHATMQLLPLRLVTGATPERVLRAA